MSPELAVVVQTPVNDVNDVCKESPMSLVWRGYGLWVAEAISDIWATDGPQGSVDVAFRTLIWIPEYPFTKFFLTSIIVLVGGVSTLSAKRI